MRALKISEKRAAERLRVEIPVHLEQGDGLSRDVSTAGIYFTTDCCLLPESEIRFALELNHVFPGEKFEVHCRGRVVRVEKAGDRAGVAASIEDHWTAA